MPHYQFENTETGEIKDFFFRMKEAPSAGSQVIMEGGLWKRLLTLPQAAPNGLKAIDPYSQKAFREKTGAMKGGTVGNMWDLSKEMSQRRAEKDGDDKIKRKYFDDYAKRKRGIRHTAELAEGHKAAKEHLDKGLKKLGKEMGFET